MEKQTGNTRFMQTFVSTDCVIFGFDRNQLHVLLVERNTLSANEGHLKLPGSLIYQEEDADSAAARVLSELTGIKKMVLKQFKSFTSLQRTSNPADTLWLQQEYHNQIDRLITIAYLSICKIDRKLHTVSKYKKVVWYPVSELPSLPFDHNQIVEEALQAIRNWGEHEPSILFGLLPTKFTASALRHLYEAVYHKKCDVRNFKKKMAGMEYVIPLEEKEQRVAHRAARLFRFDRILYKKRNVSI